MAKVVAPLFGFSANGQLGKSIVNASWRGRQYVRRYVVPSNPNSADQQVTRGLFGYLQSLYKTAPALVQDPWLAFAKGQALTDRNAFTQANMKAIGVSTDMNELTLCNGAKGGVAVTTATHSTTSTSITVAPVAPTIPVGWSIDAAVAAAVRDEDPHFPPARQITAGEDLTSTYSIALTGLTGGVLYQVRVWFRYIKPDGTFAYGPELKITATPV